MKKNNKNNPFKTPEGYFDSFQDRLMDRLSEQESIIPKEDGFKVPDNYFDKFQNNLNEKLKGEVRVVKLKSYKKYFAVAAAIAALVVLGISLNKNNPSEISFTDLANSDIEAYFEYNELGLTTYEIAEVIPVDQLEIDDILENRLGEENILEYLNENVDDIEELNLEDNE